MTLRRSLNRFCLKEPYHGCFPEKALRKARKGVRRQNKFGFLAKMLKSQDDTFKMALRGARRA